MEAFATLGYGGQVAALRQLALEALAGYPVEMARLRLLDHRENTTFRVDGRDGSRYVLRIHRVTGSPFHPVRGPDEIRSELRWLLALDRAEGGGQFLVPVPVANSSGELVTVAETSVVPEARPCVLLRWVPGRFVDAGLTPTHLARVGRFMANLHRQARGFVPPADFVRPVVGDISGDVQHYVTSTVGDCFGLAAAEVVARVLDGIEALLETLGDDADAYGLIHADVHQENYLFHRGAVAAIDFDDCGWGHYASDLAVTLSELAHHDDREALRTALFDGYAEVADLPPGTEEHLTAFLARRELQLTMWFIEQRDHPDFDGWQHDARSGLDRLGSLADTLAGRRRAPGQGRAGSWVIQNPVGVGLRREAGVDHAQPTVAVGRGGREVEPRVGERAQQLGRAGRARQPEASTTLQPPRTDVQDPTSKLEVTGSYANDLINRTEAMRR